MPGFIGVPELLLLGILALVIFGPKRLPEMGRGLGKGMREFKESVTGNHELPDRQAEYVEARPVEEELVR
jgi:sec-independent protein translocase protein TatA